MDKIKYSDPILTDDQLHNTIQRIQRLNPARPHATRRTFGRRRLHQQPPVQPPSSPDNNLPHAEPTTHQFTIGLNHLPNQRLTHSLIQSLPYCVCCLCDQEHTQPTCPPLRTPHPLHRCQIVPADPDDIDPAFPHALSTPDWNALHWEVWNSPAQPHEPTSLPTTPQTPTTNRKTMRIQTTQ